VLLVMGGQIYPLLVDQWTKVRGGLVGLALWTNRAAVVSGDVANSNTVALEVDLGAVHLLGYNR